MSDLDKAIRAELGRDYWRLSRHSSTAADKGATAALALLDWAAGLEADEVSGSNRIVRTLTRQVRVILAESLGVSGEDRSERTPAPRESRVWCVGNDETEPTEPGLKILGSNGVTFERTSYGRWRALPPEGDGDNYGWSFLIGTVGLAFTEVVSPEGTA